MSNMVMSVLRVYHLTCGVILYYSCHFYGLRQQLHSCIHRLGFNELLFGQCWMFPWYFVGVDMNGMS